MRSYAISLLFFTGIGLVTYALLFTPSAKEKAKMSRPSVVAEQRPFSSSLHLKLKQRSAEARKFVRKQGFNNRYCFLLDMSRPSSQNRFFVYDLQKDSIIAAGLVTHGRCNEDWLEGRRYGNEVGCGCTSLGRYRIGAFYTGRFGPAFKLHGLDKTNDKAYERYVVLHSHSCVPDKESTSEICQSDGCPTVSPGFLKKLQSILGQSGNKVVLWIFE